MFGIYSRTWKQAILSKVISLPFCALQQENVDWVLALLRAIWRFFKTQRQIYHVNQYSH